MTLKIEPGTPKGDAQLEAIKWAEEQMNIVLANWFANKYKLVKGVRFAFDFGSTFEKQRRMSVDIEALEPETQAKAEEAMKEAIEGLHLKKEK